ncbi:MAG: c-type cytochrome [Sphingorhabdus sp.]
MIARVGIAAALAFTLAACGGESQPAADTAETTTPAVEPVAAVAKTGEEVFKKCAICHTVDKGGSNGIGPNLHGVAGAKVAAVAGYTYSPAMTAKGGVWDDASLDAYLVAPAKTVPGNKMAFAGVSDAAERTALIDYLKTLK